MLTGKEIVAIIKAASLSNVAKLEVDGIKIHFKDASLYSAANMKQQAKVLKLDELTAEQATVNVLSPMAQFGLNVFEGIRCYWNQDKGELHAFRLKEHLDRLMLSSRLVRLPSPKNKSLGGNGTTSLRTQ